MNKQIKKEWVKALRSGEYSQGRNVLCNRNNEYCCLGVLQDLYYKSCGKIFSDDEKSYTMLSKEVAFWAGLGREFQDRDPKVNLENIPQPIRLSIINDGGWFTSDVHDSNKSYKVERRSFNEIANLIEEQL